MLTRDDFRAEEGLFTRAVVGGPQGQSRSPGLEWGPQPHQGPGGGTQVGSRGGAGGERPCPPSLPPLQSPVGAPTGQTQPGEGHWAATDAVHTGRPPGARRSGEMGGRRSWRTEAAVRTGPSWAPAGQTGSPQPATWPTRRDKSGLSERTSVARTFPQNRPVSQATGRREEGLRK